MKQTLLIIFLISLSAINMMSQTTNTYVNKYERQGNLLYLYMNTNEYKSLSDDGKANLVTKEASKHQVQTVYVIYDYDGELWQMADNSMEMIDSWDKDHITLAKGKRFIRSIEHPWFFNISGAINYDAGGIRGNNPSNVYFNAYGRSGCYLLKGRWDLGLNLLLGYNKNSEESKGSFTGSISMDSRVYILKGKAVNPFAGLGFGYAFGSGQSSFTIPISAGMSISIKENGFIDLCYQYNNVTKSSIIVGYTYIHK